MSDRIKDLSDFICGKIPALIEEAREQINESINAKMEEAQDTEDGKAVLSLSIAVKWDLDGNGVTVTMPVAVKRKFEAVGKLDDPNQPKLPGIEGGVA